MSSYCPCLPAPGPLQDYAVQFDSLFNRLSQRQSFRTYLAGLLLPRDRSKTLTAIAGAEPWVQAQSPKVQQLQLATPILFIRFGLGCQCTCSADWAIAPQ